eukprot:m.129529 g.129529  ORF g.129529 m.129529 type:complete len:353 (+) comp19950_c1_seq1:41-1099(+)
MLKTTPKEKERGTHATLQQTPQKKGKKERKKKKCYKSSWGMQRTQRAEARVGNICVVGGFLCPHHFEHSALLLALEGGGDVALHVHLEALCLQAGGRSKIVDNIFGLSKVDFIQRVSHLVFHVLDHVANVGDMGADVADSEISLVLARQAPTQLHCARAVLVGLEPEHHGGRQLVQRIFAAALLRDLDDVNGVPAALDLLRSVAHLLDEDAAGKAMVQVPQVHRRHTTLKIKVAVGVEGAVGLDLKLAQLVRGRGAVLQRRVECVGPRRAVRVAVAVVVAQQVVLLGALVFGNLQRLVDGRKQVLTQRRHQIHQAGQVFLNVLRWQTPHKIQGTVQASVRHCGAVRGEMAKA